MPDRPPPESTLGFQGVFSGRDGDGTAQNGGASEGEPGLCGVQEARDLDELADAVGQGEQGDGVALNAGEDPAPGDRTAVLLAVARGEGVARVQPEVTPAVGGPVAEAEGGPFSPSVRGFVDTDVTPFLPGAGSFPGFSAVPATELGSGSPSAGLPNSPSGFLPSSGAWLSGDVTLPGMRGQAMGAGEAAYGKFGSMTDVGSASQAPQGAGDRAGRYGAVETNTSPLVIQSLRGAAGSPDLAGQPVPTLEPAVQGGAQPMAPAQDMAAGPGRAGIPVQAVSGPVGTLPSQSSAGGTAMDRVLSSRGAGAAQSHPVAGTSAHVAKDPSSPIADAPNLLADVPQARSAREWHGDDYETTAGKAVRGADWRAAQASPDVTRGLGGMAGPALVETATRTLELRAGSLRGDVGEASVQADFGASDTAVGEVRTGSRTASAGPLPTFNPPDGSRNAALQIADVIRTSGERAVELRLHPEELGRVQLTLSQDASGTLTVSLNVERADTLDLLRRNIDLLGAELRELGYRTVDFSFNGEGAQGRDDPSPTGQSASTAPDATADGAQEPAPSQTTAASNHGPSGAGIDMRL